MTPIGDARSVMPDTSEGGVGLLWTDRSMSLHAHCDTTLGSATEWYDLDGTMHVLVCAQEFDVCLCEWMRSCTRYIALFMVISAFLSHAMRPLAPVVASPCARGHEISSMHDLPCMHVLSSRHCTRVALKLVSRPSDIHPGRS